MASTTSGAPAGAVSRSNGTMAGPQRRALILVPPGSGSMASSKAHRSLPQHARSSISRPMPAPSGSSEGRGADKAPRPSGLATSLLPGERVALTLVELLPVVLDLVGDEEGLVVARQRHLVLAVEVEVQVVDLGAELGHHGVHERRAGAPLVDDVLHGAQ